MSRKAFPQTSPEAASKPENPQRLGRSRTYTAKDLPARLTHWHSPRINRWERLSVAAGALAIERLEASGTVAEQLKAGQTCWIAPGVRWRVVETQPATRFEFEVYADSLGQADAPQTLRSELLDDAERVTVPHPDALLTAANTLAPGERRLIELLYSAGDAIARLLCDETLFWHPLTVEAEGLTALIARAEQPFGLAEYLGRDHAVIEAALAGTLRGNETYRRWLDATLERHLHIEERLLFPAYVEAGGNESWVRGLKNEHQHLRQYLGELHEAHGRRKFMRLLDGHDEKEECTVYPDILDHLGDSAETLLAQAKALAVPA